MTKFNIHDWQAQQRFLNENSDYDMASQEKFGMPYDKLGEYDQSVIRDEVELDENSLGTGASMSTGASDAYATPKAFAKKGKWKGKEVKYEAVNEISYAKFKKNTSASPKQKISAGIKMVDRMLREIEKVVDHNQKLKTETDVKSDNFTRGTTNKLNTIAAKLIKLGQKIKEFSS